MAGKLTDEQIEQLSMDWRAGVLVHDIERRFSCSKGTIMGHVHRNKLERPEGFTAVRISRKWPTGVKIVTGRDDPENIPKNKVAFDPIPSPHEQITAAHDRNIATPIITARPRKISPFDNLAARAKIAEAPLVKYRPTKECCWPIGTPRTSNFRFCGSAHQNRTYCDDHQAMAHVPTPRLNMSGISR